MEQKLADFRARKKAVKDAKKTDHQKSSSKSCYTDKLAAPSDTSKSVQPNVYVESNKASDWLLDSALGRWLGVQRLAFTNLTLLKVLLWLVLLGLFSELDFGLPFFLISLFYWLYEGLRKPTTRQPGELSAYSVFNPNCQPIMGTLTAEQLEGEMGYRPMANRICS
ncbi:SAYSvFN domain-containing protein 1 [Electrophorus electricus]|uniref:SAYSvFN domain-containing protein n=1 Tax=Electrophorus electricus TaxID=8005 RepID=A0A4W4EV83_ELEEL|nr:SAYSvFN domain-containing protein 1 [Electrophorus electricus]